MIEKYPIILSLNNNILRNIKREQRYAVAREGERMQVYEIPINTDKMETTRHGTEEFPMAVYETVLAKNVLGFVDWHWHDELQFCRCVQGQAEIVVGRTASILSAGMGVFINSGVMHMAKPLTSDAAYECIDVHPSLLCGLPSGVIGTKYVMPLAGDPTRAFLLLSPEEPWQGQILEELEKIHREYEQREYGYELSVTGRLLFCIRLIVRERGEGEFCSGNPEESRLKALTSFIHSHYKEKITLEQLAEAVSLCPNECCRYFKKHMNGTLFGYINQVRVAESARALLEQPDRTISWIAYEYGFSTTSYYIRKFKEATGLTPSRWRKDHSEPG